MTGMKQITKLRSTGADPRLTWQGIVDYANADLSESAKEIAAVENLVHRCLGAGSLSARGETFKKQAIHYQPHVRKLLYWLCRPTEKTLIPIEEPSGRPPLMVHPVEFLNGELHGSSGRLNAVESNFDEDSSDCFPFYFQREVEYSTVIAPICKFIVDQLDESGEMAPVRICEREGCGKFTLPERQGRKRFCSDQCRALAYQGSRDDWNEYMRTYRKIQSQRKRRKGGK
jgi:hypothetical protein